jgi:hypothetical protein
MSIFPFKNKYSITKIIGAIYSSILVLLAIYIISNAILYFTIEKLRDFFDFLNDSNVFNFIYILTIFFFCFIFNLLISSIIIYVKIFSQSFVRFFDFFIKFLSGLPVILLFSSMLVLLDEFFVDRDNFLILFNLISIACLPTAISIISASPSKNSDLFVNAKRLGMSNEFYYWRIYFQENFDTYVIGVAVGLLRLITEFSLLANTVDLEKNNLFSDSFLNTINYIIENINILDNFILIILIFILSFFTKFILLLALSFKS